MKKIFCFLSGLFLLVTANCQTTYWQQQTNYILDVTLNDTDNTLDGFEKLTYTNNSPDTLHYIWFHLWPNAYKNDRTSFSEQLLRNGRTDFYFSNKEQRGYINRLDFKVAGVAAKTEDHPNYIDVVKVILPKPLPPKANITITTPFHVKLPYNFSRGGYNKQTYQLTQWFPKPAVYDAQGWHPLPYLDQGEFYADFGSYDVRITLPAAYVVAATGELQNDEEKEWIKQKRFTQTEKISTKKQSAKPVVTNKKQSSQKKPVAKEVVTLQPSPKLKTLQFIQDSVHDFALFVNKDFIVDQDTCMLPSGKVVNVVTYYTAAHQPTWKNSLQFCKDALRFYSAEVGEYPYTTLSAVEGPVGFAGGMEYPTITIISPMQPLKDLDRTLAHEIGHNWFYGILASNERDYPWMDEGINTFYERKYIERKYGDQPQVEEILFQTLAKNKRDQPIETTSQNFSEAAYGLVAYHKTAQWIKLLEERLGTEAFKKAVQQYYASWRFKHPQPTDFKNAFQPYFENNTDSLFGLINKNGLLPNQHLSGLKIVTPLGPKTFHRYLLHPTKNTLLLSPALGYNNYDKAMVGAIISNYSLPPTSFRFTAVPLYATGSKNLNGIGKMSYSFYPTKTFQKIDVGISGASFSKNRSLDSNENKVFERFSKVVPSIRATFKQSPASTKEVYLEARSFFIKEDEFSKFVVKSTNGLSYVDSNTSSSRSVHQVSFFSADNRALYPYDYTLQLQGGKGFYRANITANYFFNYAKGGGASVRGFFSKFGYINKSGQDAFSTFIYQPKLLGATGEEDYTYSNYFLGRTASYANDASVSENSGLAAQQIMIRDGGMKLRIDQYSFLQGRSEDWVGALNFTTTLPKNIFPIPVPLKLFLDAGTYAEAWKDDAPTSKFLYVGGLQLSFSKNLFNVYLPLVYSADFRTYLKTLPEQNTFTKRITFSIDLQKLSQQKFFGNTFSF